ncbi:MAG: TadE/TadG family type IV pilus assembly protein [Acidimicrobiia bacterium]
MRTRLNRLIHHRRNAAGDDSGAILVEAVLVMPVLLLIMMGFMEYSNLFKDSMSVKNSAQIGGREASASGAQYDADYNVLLQTRKSLSTISDGVDRVVIFKATNLNSTVPAACKTVALSGGVGGSAADKCNVYSGGYIAGLDEADRADFGYAGVDPKNDQYYPALQRQQSRSGVVEYIGVYVKASYAPITRAVPTPTVLESTTILRIESRTA